MENLRHFTIRLVLLGMGVIGITFSSQTLAHEKYWSVPNDARIEGVTSGIVEGAENDPVAMACKGFNLTRDQILTVFRHARIVNAYELHYEYDQAPCYITGKLSWAQESVTWQIDALLVARIRFRDGREIVLGCDEKCTALVYPDEEREKLGAPTIPPARPQNSH